MEAEAEAEQDRPRPAGIAELQELEDFGRRDGSKASGARHAGKGGKSGKGDRDDATSRAWYGSQSQGRYNSARYEPYSAPRRNDSRGAAANSWKYGAAAGGKAWRSITNVEHWQPKPRENARRTPGGTRLTANAEHRRARLRESTRYTDNAGHWQARQQENTRWNRRDSEVAEGLATVVVGNLTCEVMPGHLEDIFEDFGVQRAWIDYDSTDRSEGTGGVVFSSPRSAAAACNRLHGSFVDGQRISAWQADPSSGQDRGKGRRRRL